MHSRWLLIPKHCSWDAAGSSSSGESGSWLWWAPVGSGACVRWTVHIPLAGTTPLDRRGHFISLVGDPVAAEPFSSQALLTGSAEPWTTSSCLLARCSCSLHSRAVFLFVRSRSNHSEFGVLSVTARNAVIVCTLPLASTPTFYTLLVDRVLQFSLFFSRASSTPPTRCLGTDTTP